MRARLRRVRAVSGGRRRAASRLGRRGRCRFDLRGARRSRVCDVSFGVLERFSPRPIGRFQHAQACAFACQPAASLRSAALSPQQVVSKRCHERRTRLPQAVARGDTHSHRGHVLLAQSGAGFVAIYQAGMSLDLCPLMPCLLLHSRRRPIEGGEGNAPSVHVHPEGSCHLLFRGHDA